MRTSILLSLSLAVLACNKDNKDGPSAKSAEPTAGPVKITPAALFDDFTSQKLDGMALLDKYREGATFTASVSNVGAEEDGSPIVWLDVDGKRRINVKFTDPAKGKAAKQGASLTVTCKIGGASGVILYATDCT